MGGTRRTQQVDKVPTPRLCVLTAPVDRLTLLESRRFERSENVLLRYAAAGR